MKEDKNKREGRSRQKSTNRSKQESPEKKKLKKPDDENNSDNDQRSRYRITEKQRQREKEQRAFEEKYKEKTNKKKTAEPKKEEAEGDTQKDRSKKARSKKKFFDFVKELQKKSKWKTIISNLRNLFKNKKQILEEEILISNLKKKKLESLFGIRRKSQEKELTARIAYLMQELRNLKNQASTLQNIKQILKTTSTIVVLTESHLKSNAAAKGIKADHIKAKIATTHLTVKEATSSSSNTKSLERSVLVEKANGIMIRPFPNENAPQKAPYPYMMQAQPTSVDYSRNMNVNFLFTFMMSKIHEKVTKAASYIERGITNFVSSLVPTRKLNAALPSPQSSQFSTGPRSYNHITAQWSQPIPIKIVPIISFKLEIQNIAESLTISTTTNDVLKLEPIQTRNREV